MISDIKRLTKERDIDHYRAPDDCDTFITEFFLQTAHSNDIDLFCFWKLDDGGKIYSCGICRSVDFVLCSL